ncbi:hypothetical protein [Tepidibacillus sp. HK-1]|uniref:hypothetical protein n=1 Tax=Tepidibacillus sp. HK-1 TaxID=1883407 RepID=UPI00085391D7|nr:hypothetical protein [Tepidibacillus sp. HK-1]GBF11703.1 hypothetical protein HK1_01742 [Tepidibacillus sp. HK-1]
MLYFIITIGLSYLFYRQGIRYLFKSRLLSDNRSEHFAYIFLMLSGVALGEYLSLTVIESLFNYLTTWEMIVITTFVSISSGEYVYYRNNKLVQRVVMNEKK